MSLVIAPDGVELPWVLQNCGEDPYCNINPIKRPARGTDGQVAEHEKYAISEKNKS
jgi:hypothetical protein